ncbi:magnesium transporter [Eubacteriales bacterium KG127]
MKKILKEPIYINKLLSIFRSEIGKEEIFLALSDFHKKDIADAVIKLTSTERKSLYSILGAEYISEIISYIDNPEIYLDEIGIKHSAEILSCMDSDDAVDILEKLAIDKREALLGAMNISSRADIDLILSYPTNEIGRKMTTNFVVIKKNFSIRGAMRDLIRQAGEHDNISTLYVVGNDDKYYGAISLEDLIIARVEDKLENLISVSYPHVNDHELISDCIERIKEYDEDSIPVLSADGRILGAITSSELIEVVDDEMSEDYARLGGLRSEEDLNETTGESIKKRLPWLIILLFLGIGVSSVVGIFETVVSVIPVVICFQSLILDMAGNVGTQSLAVTIRVLMDGEVTATEKLKLVFKEMKIGFSTGLLLGLLTIIFISAYTYIFKSQPIGTSFLIAGCVGLSLVIAMVISSLVGTLVPMFFHRMNIDPAVASGPLITTVNDMVAVITYYGLVWFFLIDIFKLAG